MTHAVTCTLRPGFRVSQLALPTGYDFPAPALNPSPTPVLELRHLNRSGDRCPYLQGSHFHAETLGRMSFFPRLCALGVRPQYCGFLDGSTTSREVSRNFETHPSGLEPLRKPIALVPQTADTRATRRRQRVFG